MRFLLPVLLVCFVTAPAAAQSGQSAAPARNGLVVSSHYLGSEVGLDILKKGGNAIDAAVATAFALAVVYPEAGNIGGGGFITYHGADGHVTTFNFREKAPLAAHENMFQGPDGRVLGNANHEGPLSVGVPGTVAGLYLAHKRLGRLPWRDLVEPAVLLARDGFPSTWDMQVFLHELSRENRDLYRATREAFLKGGTELFEPGERFLQPDLARSLERIRDGGHDGFYRGETAQLLADFMAKHGGLISMEDLASYEAVEQPPVSTTYRGFDVYAMGPPSSSGVGLIQVLNILEGFDLTAAGHNSAQYLHLVTEALRRAFADRAEYLGDPAFNPDMPIERLTSKSYSAQLRAGIDLFAASASDTTRFGAQYAPVDPEHTTHFSVVDADGNAVSLTYTLEHGFGSRLVADGTGFLLNNEMGDFNVAAGPTRADGTIGTRPNLIRPGQRMRSAMTPTVVALNGKPSLVTGSPGGLTIISTTLQVILNMIDHRMHVADAVEAPRMHHQWLPNRTRFESPGFSPDTIRLYELMGHEVWFEPEQGRANSIWIDPRTRIRYGAADSRDFDARSAGY